MFFPDLLNLRKRQVNNHDIDILDWWLGTRKQNTRKYLNPLQFSIDCKIDFGHAIKLFTICVLDSNIKLLSVRYVVRCPNCLDVIEKQENLLNVTCYNGKSCGSCGNRLYIESLIDTSDVYFTLLKKPQENMTHDIPLGLNRGKSESLHGSQIKEIIKEDEDLGRLFSCLST
jgi:hypothetical protein